MARLSVISAVAGAQWQAYRRSVLRRGGAGGINLGVSVLLAALLLPWFVGALRIAATELANGEAARTAMLLCWLAAAWLYVGLAEARLSLRTDELRHLPLSSGELFAVDLLSMLMQFPAWIVAAASLMICYPMVNGAHPARGVATVLLYTTASCGMGYAVSRLSIRNVGHNLLRLAAIGLVLLALWSITADVDSSRVIDLERFGALLPHGAAARAATAKGTWIELLTLACATCVACGLARASFAASSRFTARRAPRRRYFTAINLPGALGGLAGKELRYFSRVLDVYVGFALAPLYGFHLVTTGAPSPDGLRAVLVGVLLTNASVAFNCFGLDARAGFDRYAVLPLRGAGVLRVKNAAFGLLIAMQTCPLVALASWRFGVSTAAAAVLQTIALACTFMAYGNVLSVLQNYEMRFYRFAGGGSPLDYIVGAIFGCVPGAIFVVSLRDAATTAAVLTCILCTILCASLYAYSIAWSGRRFERDREQLVTRQS